MEETWLTPKRKKVLANGLFILVAVVISSIVTVVVNNLL